MNTELKRAAILVVDDEPLVMRVVIRTLEGANYKVFAAADVHEGYRLCQEHAAELDAALLDLVMPGMGRASLFQCLHSHAHIHVIIMTGYAPDEAARRLGPAETLDVRNVLQKPFRPTQLLSYLERILARPRELGA